MGFFDSSFTDEKTGLKPVCHVTVDKASIEQSLFVYKICSEAVSFVLLSFCLQKRKIGNNFNICE